MRKSYRIQIRQIIALLLYYSGIVPLLLYFRTRKKIFVLTYHHVIPDQINIVPLPIGTYVKQETFRKQMQYIVKHFRVLSLKEFLDGKLQLEKLKTGCLITFDDGWSDSYHYAFEILIANKIPAVIFLPTKFIEDDYLSVDKIFFWIIRLISPDSENKDPTNLELARLFQNYDLTFFQNVKKINDQELSDLLTQLKNMDSAYLEKFAKQLKIIHDHYAERENSPITPKIINWTEIDKLSSSGFEFGSHTHRHIILTQDHEQEMIKEEIYLSKEILTQHFQTAIQSFAYPDGKWNVDIAKMVKEAKYSCAFSNSPGYCDGQNPYAIPRINIHEDVTFTKALFTSELSGVFRIFKPI